MNRRPLAIVLLVPFLALTLWALFEVGLTGILGTLRSPGGAQVFVDLIIALVLLLTFLVPHARSRARNPWPWVLLTFALGSIAPLLYFATERDDAGPER